MPGPGRPFQKGQGGKPKGAINKTAQKVKEAFAQLLEDNLDQMYEDLASLKPKERLDFMKDLSEYIMPKLARVQSDIEIGEETRQVLRSWTIQPVPPKDAD